MKFNTNLFIIFSAILLVGSITSCKTTKLEETEVSDVKPEDGKFYNLVIKEGYSPEELIEDYKKGFTSHKALQAGENIWLFEYAISDQKFQEQYAKLANDHRIVQATMVGKNLFISKGKTYQLDSGKAPVR